MPMYETPQQKRDRQMRMQVSYPELRMATPSQLLNTDSYTASQGRLPTQATRNMYRTANIAVSEVSRRERMKRAGEAAGSFGPGGEPIQTQRTSWTSAMGQLRTPSAYYSQVGREGLGRDWQTRPPATDYEAAIFELESRGTPDAIREAGRLRVQQRSGAPFTGYGEDLSPGAFARTGLQAIGFVGEQIDRFTGAPIRAGLLGRNPYEGFSNPRAQSARDLPGIRSLPDEDVIGPLSPRDIAGGVADIALDVGTVASLARGGVRGLARAGQGFADDIQADLARQAVRQAEGSVDESVLSPAMRQIDGGAVEPVIPGVTPRQAYVEPERFGNAELRAFDERLLAQARKIAEFIKDRPAGFSIQDLSKSDNPIERATAKLIAGLQEERRLRRTGIAGRELAEGRRAQAAAVRQAREGAIARGLTGDEILRAEKAAAKTGAIRRTFTVPDWDDEEFNVLLRMLNESEVASDFDTLGLGIALSNWRKGIAPPQPKQIKNIGRILGGEVQGIADDVAAEARAFRQEMQEIARMRRGLESTSRRQTAQFLRQEADESLRQIAERRGLLKVTDEDLPLPPKPSLEVQRRASIATPEAARRAGLSPEDVTRAKNIIKSYDDAVMKRTRQQFDDVERQLLALEAAERKVDEAFVAQRRAWETADQRLARETREMNERLSRQRPAQAGKDIDERIAELDRAEIERLSRATKPEMRMPILDDATARRLEQQEIAAGRRRQERIEAAAARPSRSTNAQQVRAQEAWDRANPNPEMILRNVPERLKGNKDAEEIIRAWEYGNRAIVDRVNGGDAFNVFRRIEAGVKGEVGDSAVNAILVRESLLADTLKRAGVEPDDAKQIARSLTDRELMLKYGVSTPDSVPAPVREMISNARNIPYEQSIGGLTTLNQQAKNTMFGLTDAGIFGQQGLAAIHNGGLPAVLGMVNRLLGMAHLPHVQTMMADVNLPKQMQYAVDGLNVGLKASGIDPGAGTLLRRFGKPGQAADDFITPIIDKWTEFQFSTVLGNLRQIIYEGDLMMAKAAGQDISNPAVRFRAAENANHITSFARSATKATRRSVEEVLFTSPAMNRARIARINDMAKLLGPTTPPDERLFAASMIFSNVLMTMMVGKLIYDQIGVGEFTVDPSDPNYGKITTAAKNDKGQNIVVDYLPQDAIQRAFAQSIRALLEADPQTAAQVWARAGISGGSPVSRPAATGLGFSYDPESGYNIFEYPESASSAVAGMAPIPPIAQSALRGETSPLDLATEAIAVPTYPESPSAASRRSAYSELKGRAQFEGVPSEAWRRMSQAAPIKRQMGDATNIRMWRDAKEAELKKLRLIAEMEPGQQQAAIERAIQSDPFYQTYLEVRRRLIDTWVIHNPEEAVKLDNEESDKPWNERKFTPTKAQREFMDAYIRSRR